MKPFFERSSQILHLKMCITCGRIIPLIKNDDVMEVNR